MQFIELTQFDQYERNQKISFDAEQVISVAECTQYIKSRSVPCTIIRLKGNKNSIVVTDLYNKVLQAIVKG